MSLNIFKCKIWVLISIKDSFLEVYPTMPFVFRALNLDEPRRARRRDPGRRGACAGRPGCLGAARERVLGQCSCPSRRAASAHPRADRRWLQQGPRRGTVPMLPALPFLEAAVRLPGWRPRRPLSSLLERAQFSACR